MNWTVGAGWVICSCLGLVAVVIGAWVYRIRERARTDPPRVLLQHLPLGGKARYRAVDWLGRATVEWEISLQEPPATPDCLGEARPGE